MRGMEFALLGIIGAIVYILVVSCHVQARVINANFGTDYTASEMFFASETIERVIIGNRERLDVNLTK